MNQTTGSRRKAQKAFAALALVFALSTPAFAQEKNCIQLTTTGEVEESYVNAQGQKATRLVPPAKVVPGSEIVWTLTAKNVCAKAADGIVINNNVPEHMTFVASSAMGTGTTITYSLDGKTFKAANELTVTENGASRAARPDEFRAVRWTYTAAFAPNSTAFVRYRAKVE
jgi:uncharacterized repeat protein (TIGR01451 family)